jgi:predicted transcriptional regulator
MTISEMTVPQKRARGGGRKPRGEFSGNSAILTVRVRPELRAALQRLAERHCRSLSQEMQRGLDAWVGQRRDHKRHVAALAHAVTILVEGVERATGKGWHEDAFTGEALRHAVEFLISHFATEATRPVPIPSRVEEAASRMPPAWRERARTAADVGMTQAGWVITLIESAPAANTQQPPLGVVPLDDWGFWKILRDIGSGWERNREARKPKGGA